MCLAQQVWGHVGGGGEAAAPLALPSPPLPTALWFLNQIMRPKKKKMILIYIGEAEDKEYTAGIYMNKQGKS